MIDWIELGLANLNAAQGLLDIANDPKNGLDDSYRQRAQEILDKEKRSLKSYGVKVKFSRQRREWEIV